jgi:hypothetical protein
MGRLYRRLKTAILLDRAYQLAAHSRYEEALKCLEAAEKLGLPQRRGKWTKAFEYAQLLKALLKIRLHYDDEEALKILVMMQEYFIGLPNQTSEVLYLQCFASVLAGDPIKNLKHSDLSMRGLNIFKTPYEAVNIDAVPTHVKKKIPSARPSCLAREKVTRIPFLLH